MSNLKDIFKAYDIRGKVGDELSEEFVHKIGSVFADWLPTEGIIAVGHDMRPDSRSLAESFIQGLREQGRDVWDIGLVTSDMIYFAVGKWDLAGGAVITASHNPGSDNGIKLYRDKVTPVGLDSGLDEIRDMSINYSLSHKESLGAIEVKSITQEWVDHCMTFVDDKMADFSIAIDCGNGMAGAILPSILPLLPFTVKEMYFDLDGTFPNHEANPQKPENLADLSKQVVENNLDFGIAFDGDGDRAGFVDDLGRQVLGTDLITIVSKLYLEKHPGGEIIHDVRTSRSTVELIESWGGSAFRTKAGRVNIGAVLRERGAVFGGETTGHLFFTENYDADSGLIAALVVCQALSKEGIKLSDLVNKYRSYVMDPEQNFKVSKDKEQIFSLLRQDFDGKADDLDGLTINMKNSWFNLRSSNTEPVMRLNAEATDRSELDALVSKITDVIDS
jgi:phosphomannomutase